jgi:hypothetical protein
MAAWYCASDTGVLPAISQAVAERNFLLIHGRVAFLNEASRSGVVVIDMDEAEMSAPRDDMPRVRAAETAGKANPHQFGLSSRAPDTRAGIHVEPYD